MGVRRYLVKRNEIARPGWLTVVVVGVCFVAALFWSASPLQQAMTTAFLGQLNPLNSDSIYNLTNIWTIHLKFAPDQWEAMEPKGGGNPFFGGGGRQGGFRGAREDRALTPVIMSQADFNRDGRITAREFSALGEKWFKAWDTDGRGALDENKIRAGLNAIRNPAGNGVATMLLAPEGKRNGIGFALGLEFEYVHADLEFEGRLLRDVGVRYKGNGSFMESRNSLKRSIKIQLNRYVKGQSLGDVRTLTLQNNVTDASKMNEVLAYRLYRDAGVPAPRTAYARVFVSVPGKYDRQYLGLYSVTEAVDKRFAQRHFGTKRGAIFKPVTPSLFTDLGADWAAYNQIYDPKTPLYDEQKKAVIELSHFVTEADDAKFAARIGEFIDLPEFARFMAVMVYLSDLDGILGPGQNVYLHLHPKTQQFQFIPWDQDHSWGQFNRASQEQRDKLSINRPWGGENFFLERMFKVETFKKLYLASLEEFSKTIFLPERLAQQVDEIATIIRPAIQEESESQLTRFDTVVSGEPLAALGPFGGGQTKPIKPFTKARTESVRDQLAGKSEGLRQGGGFQGGFGGGSGLGTMFGRAFSLAFDKNQDSIVSKTEFTEGFSELFESWDHDKKGSLTWAQLRSGVEKDLASQGQGFIPFGGGPGGRRGGPSSSEGGPNSPGGTNRGLPPTITGTRDPGLFASEHWGMQSFSYKIPNGKYLVKLYFAENYDRITGPGQRVFSFNVQGHEFKDFDIWVKAGGPRRAYIETVPVEVTNGEIRIVFTPKIENPTINAIEIIPRPENTSDATSGPAAVRINAGSPVRFTDSSGQIWEPDTGFEGGMMSRFSGGPAGSPWDAGIVPPMDQRTRVNNPSQRPNAQTQ